MMMVRFGKHALDTTLYDKIFGAAKRLSTISNLIDIQPEVRDALAARKPVVALESTIITHGMPHPENLETAIAVENIVRKQNAIPATIAILNGRVKVGLNSEEMTNLASLTSDKVVKCSRRDLGYVLSNHLSAGTTVAGTSIIANMVGINVFATGGIGGVHRDGHISMDISADLAELARTPICVVSSGIKSILDIPRTLEYLETQGVCVATYQSDSRDFPAFYTRSSGVKVPYNLNSPLDVALMMKSILDMKLGSGILIGVPIPQEYAADEKLINDAIDYALLKASKKAIVGKEVTPFVLQAVARATAGKSLESNIALIKNNALVASQIAVQLRALQNNNEKIRSSSGDIHESNKFNNVPVVVGASILDMCMTCLEDDLKLDGATYKSKSFLSGGGVGRNIAEGIYKLHGNVHLISAIGNDESGNSLNSYLPATATVGVIRDAKKATSICAVICDKLGDCKLVLGDMKIHSSITPELIKQNEQTMSLAPLIIMDANIELDTMAAVLNVARKHHKPVFFEPTDMRIADKPFSLDNSLTNQIKFISPNIYELHKIVLTLNPNATFSKIDTSSEAATLKTAKYLAEKISEHFDIIIVTLGPLGVLIASKSSAEVIFNQHHQYVLKQGDTKYRHYRAPTVSNIVNVSGAGDSFTSGFIAAMLEGAREENCVAFGFKAAQRALLAESAVPEIYFTCQNEKFDWLKSEAPSDAY